MCGLKFANAFLLAAVQFGTILGYDEYYTAAVVDFSPTSLNTTTGFDNVMRHTNNYVELIGGTKQPLDIIVFPEMTLMFECWGTGNSSCATPIPNPEDKVIPCNLTGSVYEAYLVELSCAAKKYRTYISVNMGELFPCLHQPNCSRNGYNIYSTNVVFDRNGTVISRYRKYNAVDELVNTTLKAEAVTFETDFGVTFGVLTSYDIIFDKPARTLLDMGIKHFVFPLTWMSEMPLFTSIQMQQMWSYENDVALLAACGNYPELASGGSGIYQGRHGPLVTQFVNTFESKVLVHKVQKSWGSLPSVLPTPPVNNGLDDYTFIMSDLTGASLLPLDLNKLNHTVCTTGDFCCHFNVKVADTSVKHNYSLIAYNQIRSLELSRKVGLQLCAILNCKTTSCNKPISRTIAEAYPIEFQIIEMSAVFSTNRTAQYPNSLTRDFNPLPVDHFRWEMKKINDTSVLRMHSLVKPRTDILAFAIVGREFARDNDVGQIQCHMLANGTTLCEDTHTPSIYPSASSSITPVRNAILMLVSLYCLIFV